MWLPFIIVAFVLIGMSICVWAMTGRWKRVNYPSRLVNFAATIENAFRDAHSAAFISGARYRLYFSRRYICVVAVEQSTGKPRSVVMNYGGADSILLIDCAHTERSQPEFSEDLRDLSALRDYVEVDPSGRVFFFGGLVDLPMPSNYEIGPRRSDILLIDELEGGRRLYVDINAESGEVTYDFELSLPKTPSATPMPLDDHLRR